MNAIPASRSGFVALSLVALTWLVTCSSQAEDGDSCSKGGDCKSGHCSSTGTCDGSDCTCEGSDCRGRSSCREGWLCTRTDATTFDAIPQCRQQCGGTAGTCPSDKHCDNGICREGAEPFALSFVNIPRTVACAANVPCKYEVKASEGVTVDTYTWTFGNAPPVDTKEPTNSFTYPMTGTYAVAVRARATTGAVAEVDTTEVLCVGALGAECDPSGSPCCEGSCSALLVCK
ncbi:MAG: hypothetical protein JWP87_1515 [Labilithrix sp.]|nr:hypothetical protein [Labilithrix sp.]